MLQGRQSSLLVNETEVVISSLVGQPSLYNLVKKALTKARNRSTTKIIGHTPWPILPLTVCEAISGHYEHAIPAAVSLELFKAAAEVFDDTEDLDSPESIPAEYGTAVAINIANTLLVLAEKAITRLKTRSVADQVIIRIIDLINTICIKACAGQHLDLSISLNMAISEKKYFEVAGMKSASQIECACQVGALLATGDQKLINDFASFGHNLGVASQIVNDIQGIIRGTDILKRKITLPIIYALNQTDSDTCDQLKAFLDNSSKSVPDTKQISSLLFRTGAIHYATIKMEFYKQKALELLLCAERNGANIESLKLFLK